MNNKTKRFFSIALIAVVSLSIFTGATSAMAEDTTDTDVFCEPPMYDDQEYVEASSFTVLKPIVGYDTTNPDMPFMLSTYKLSYSDNVRHKNIRSWIYVFNVNRYIVLEFQKLPAGASVTDVTLKFEWQRNGHIDDARLWVYGKPWPMPEYPTGDVYSLKPLPASDTDRCETISLDSYPFNIDTREEVNNLKIWFQATGGAGDRYTQLDWVEIQIGTPEPEPDLVITDIWNDDGTIYYKIKNEGDKEARSSHTSLNVDYDFKTSDYVASLKPGVERTESFKYTWNCTDTSDYHACSVK